jgi:3-oxoacyl-[acyl-carrier-protein] synthase II
MKRRVVVTGIGLVSPLGIGWQSAWNSLLQGRHGIEKLTDEKFKLLPCKVAGMVPKAELNQALTKETEYHPKFIQYALIAADEAIKDASLDFNTLNKEEMVHSFS